MAANVKHMSLISSPMFSSSPCDLLTVTWQKQKFQDGASVVEKSIWHFMTEDQKTRRRYNYKVY